MGETRSAADLVPHRPPMLMVDEVVHREEDLVRVRARLKANCPFVREAEAPALVALEVMAQAAACLAGLERAGGAGGGMLIGSRELALHVDAFAVGDELEVEAKREMAMGELVRFQCAVRRGGEIVAEGQLDVRERGAEVPG